MTSSGFDRLAERALRDMATARSVFADLTVEEPRDVLPDADALRDLRLAIVETAAANADPPFTYEKWQLEIVASDAKLQIRNSSRQVGKTEGGVAKAAGVLTTTPNAFVALTAAAHRQPIEMQRRLVKLLRPIEGQTIAGWETPRITRESQYRVELSNGARCQTFPANEHTTRGFSAAHLLVVDEASRVSDDMLAALAPSLATTNGTLLCLSTPFARRGFFYEAWVNGGPEWERGCVFARDCPRISPQFLDAQRRLLGPYRYSMEYDCQFQDDEAAFFSSAIIQAAFSDDVKPLWPVWEAA